MTSLLHHPFTCSFTLLFLSSGTPISTKEKSEHFQKSKAYFLKSKPYFFESMPYFFQSLPDLKTHLLLFINKLTNKGHHKAERVVKHGYSPIKCWLSMFYIVKWRGDAFFRNPVIGNGPVLTKQRIIGFWNPAVKLPDKNHFNLKSREQINLY